MFVAENVDSAEEREKNRAWVWTKVKRIHQRDVTAECQKWQEGVAMWINHAASASLTASVTLTSKKGLR